MRENKTDILLESVIGKTLKEAKNLASFNGYTIRIKQNDINEPHSYYMPHIVVFAKHANDLRFDRINIEMLDGVVIKSNIG